MGLSREVIAYNIYAQEAKEWYNNTPYQLHFNEDFKKWVCVQNHRKHGITKDYQLTVENTDQWTINVFSGLYSSSPGKRFSYTGTEEKAYRVAFWYFYSFWWKGWGRTSPEFAYNNFLHNQSTYGQHPYGM